MVIPSTVNASESLARYLTQSNHFSTATHSVKPRAFDPPPDLRLSVFRIDNLSIEDVWQIGQQHLINATSQPRNFYGIADIKADKVQELNLHVDADNIPPRHAAIVGWPDDVSSRKLLAQELASHSRLVLRS